MRNLATILFLFIGLAIQAQTFRAMTNAQEVVEGSSFNVSFKLENASGRGFQAPNFSPFRVTGGPSQSQQTSYVNGRRSSSITYTYRLLATEKGTFTIPPARIRAGSGYLASNSLTIRVVEGSAASDQEDIFVRLELDRDTLFIGQQLVLSLNLYSTKAVERFDIINLPEFTDIYLKQLPRYSRQARLEVVDGVQYQTQVLKRFALFPQKSGRFDFKGILVRLGIPTNERQRSSFFFTTQLKTLDISTDDFGFSVLPLPEPKPETFSGGVGQYSARAEIDKTRLTTDDAVALRLTIQGDGDRRLLLPPELNLGEAFDTYDANLLSADDKPGQDRNRFSKIYEYLVIPKETGRLELKPDFTYYSVDSQAYITIVPDTFILEVSKGTSESLALDRFNAQQDIEIEPVVYEWETYNPPTAFNRSWWYWISWALLLSVFVGLVWQRRQQLKIAGADPTILRFNRANKVATSRLKKAEQLMEAGQPKAFFEEVALATKQYLSDKLQVDPARFTRQSIGDELEALEVSSDLKADVIQLLNDCDLAIFASSYAPDMNKVYQRALKIVTQLESILGKKDI